MSAPAFQEYLAKALFLSLLKAWVLVLKTDHWLARLHIGIKVFHLLVQPVAETQAHDHQIRAVDHFNARHAVSLVRVDRAVGTRLKSTVHL